MKSDIADICGTVGKFNAFESGAAAESLTSDLCNTIGNSYACDIITVVKSIAVDNCDLSSIDLRGNGHSSARTVVFHYNSSIVFKAETALEITKTDCAASSDII